MKLRLFTLFLLAGLYTTAQDPIAIRQLQSKLQTAISDTAKVWLYNDLFIQYRDYDSALAMEVINKAIELSTNSNYKKGESQLLLNKGGFLNINGENTVAEGLMNKALQIRIATNDVAGQGYCIRSLSITQYDKNSFEAALKYFLAAAEKFETAGDEKGLSGAYIWTGNVFNQGLFQYEKAAYYFNRSLAIKNS